MFLGKSLYGSVVGAYGAYPGRYFLGLRNRDCYKQFLESKTEVLCCTGESIFAKFLSSLVGVNLGVRG